MVTVAPAAMSPKVQLSTWFGAAPLMVQLPWPLYAGSIVQLTPSPAGSGSFSVTFLAAPVPSAPLLPTVSANPIESPALSVHGFAVLVTVPAVAVPDLRLLTTIVRPTEPPTSTGLASCLLVMVSSGQCTVSDAWLVNGPPFSLPTDTEAVFG